MGGTAQAGVRAGELARRAIPHAPPAGDSALPMAAAAGNTRRATDIPACALPTRRRRQQPGVQYPYRHHRTATDAYRRGARPSRYNAAERYHGGGAPWRRWSPAGSRSWLTTSTGVRPPVALGADVNHAVPVVKRCTGLGESRETRRWHPTVPPLHWYRYRVTAAAGRRYFLSTT